MIRIINFETKCEGRVFTIIEWNAERFFFWNLLLLTINIFYHAIPSTNDGFRLV